jgi:hypothetical protein
VEFLYIKSILGLITSGIVSGSTAKIRTLIQIINTQYQVVGEVMPNGKLILCLCTLLFMLWGCSAPSTNVSNASWKTYTNSRYGFEFPYPSNWETLAAPSNDDGIAFVSPRNQSVEIRGWASNQLSDVTPQESDTKIPTSPNFKTVQGVSGMLLVDVGHSVSSMTMTLTQNQVKYYWQGRSPSQEFPDYYRLFYYIAQQYRITK